MRGYCDKCGKLLIGEPYGEVLDKDGKLIGQICLDCEEKADNPNDFRKTLIDRMVKVYGYEHKITLFFARCCDNQYISDEFLERLVRDHEAHPYVDGEEEEM